MYLHNNPEHFCEALYLTKVRDVFTKYALAGDVTLFISANLKTVVCMNHSRDTIFCAHSYKQIENICVIT